MGEKSFVPVFEIIMAKRCFFVTISRITCNNEIGRRMNLFTCKQQNLKKKEKQTDIHTSAQTHTHNLYVFKDNEDRLISGRIEHTRKNSLLNFKRKKSTSTKFLAYRLDEWKIKWLVNVCGSFRYDRVMMKKLQTALLQ